MIEAAREEVRRALQSSPVRKVAADIGVSHPTVLEFAAEGSTRTPQSDSRAKILAWAEARGLGDPTADQLSYFRGKQDALMGMMRYVVDQQAEIGRFLGALRQHGVVPRSPEELNQLFEEGGAEAELLANAKNRPQPGAAKKKEKEKEKKRA